MPHPRPIAWHATIELVWHGLADADIRLKDPAHASAAAMPQDRW
nr:hypothetical protein BN444_01743 [Xanthomonas translucens pv. translucens DSM 18974]